MKVQWQDLLSAPMYDLRNYWNDSIKYGVSSLRMIITKKLSDSNVFINQHSNY